MPYDLCTATVHNTAQNSLNNLHSYHPDNHRSSDVVYWRARSRAFYFFCLSFKKFFC